MPDWISKFLQLLKLPIKYYWVLWISSGIILFVPNTVFERFGIKIPDSLTTYSFLIFVVTTSALAVNLISYLIGVFKKQKKEKKEKEHIRKTVEKLDTKEKSLLREFVLQQSKVVKMPLDNQTVISLKNKNLIYPVGNTIDPTIDGPAMNFSIHPKYKDQLTDADLGIPEDLENLTPEEKEDLKKFLRDSRPDFVHIIDGF